MLDMEEDDNEMGCKCGCMCSCAAGAPCICTNGRRYDEMRDRAEAAEEKLAEAQKTLKALRKKLASEQQKVRVVVRRRT